MKLYHSHNSDYIIITKGRDYVDEKYSVYDDNSINRYFMLSMPLIGNLICLWKAISLLLEGNPKHIGEEPKPHKPKEKIIHRFE